MLAGRIVMGFSQGVYGATSGRVLEEFVPPHLYGVAMTLFFFLQKIVMAVTLMIASKGMPSEKDIDGLKTTEYWRFYLGFPLIFVVIALVMEAFVIRHETPKFLIAKGEDLKALESIKACYHKDEDAREVLDFLRKNSSLQTDTVTYKQALVDPEYRLTSYILMIGVAFLSMNGA